MEAVVENKLAINRYPAYKDSGVEWLGEVPAHWTLIKAKFLWEEKVDLSEKGDETLLSVSQYSGVNARDEESRSESLIGYKKVRENDLVINIMLAWLGGLGVSPVDGVVSPAYAIYRQKKEVYPKFLHYLYRTSTYLDEFARRSKGVVPSRWRMYTDDFGQVLTLLPPLEEQTRITNFLDRKTAQIDKAIAQKERLIELLKERRQIMIHQAVTLGLNPDVRMKDSGVEWIGEIPAHWEVMKNRTLFQDRKEPGNENLPLLTVSIHSAVSSEEISDEENIRGKIRIEDKSNYKLVKVGDIVFNMMRAWQGAIGAVRVNGMVSPAYIVAKPIKAFNSSFFEYQYRTEAFIQQMDRASKGITDFRKRLYWDEFKQLVTILPPEKEQTNIADFISTLNLKTEKATLSKQKEIEKLKEYKATLINSAVTGKIKIV